jgi:hypothetical protein
LDLGGGGGSGYVVEELEELEEVSVGGDRWALVS